MTGTLQVPERHAAITAAAVATELARREVVRRPWALAAAICSGLAAGVALGRSGSQPVSAARIADVLLVVAAAALAGATDPDTRRDAALVVHLGCPRTVVRLATWAAAWGPLAGSAAVVVVGTAFVDPSRAGRPVDALIAAVALPALGAWSTAGSRLPDRPTVSGDEKVDRRGRSRAWIRNGGGVLLLGLGAVAPIGSTTGSNLDLALPIGTFLVLAGFVLVGPGAVATAAALIGRLPLVAVAIAASSIRRNRRGLILPVATLAGVALLVLVQATLGTGLGEREAARITALERLGPATRAGSPDLVIVSSHLFYEPGSGDGGMEASPDLRAIRGAAPEAMVAGTDRLHLEPRSGRATLGSVRRDEAFLREDPGTVTVAVATPELLRSLDLPASLGTGRSALVLDRRVLRPDGTVKLDHRGASGSIRTYRLPARAVGRTGVPVDLPAVLLPERLIPLGLKAAAGNLALVRFPFRPSDDQVRRIDGVAERVVRGDGRIDLARSHRTDRVNSVWIRDRDGADRLLAALGVLALGAVTIGLLGLTTAVRHEDEVLLWLGSGSRLRVAVAAIRGLLVGAIGTVLGAVVGYLGVRAGLHDYALHGRFADRDPLAPIPFDVPTSAVVALVALPLVGATLSVLLAAVPRTSREVALVRDQRRSA